MSKYDRNSVTAPINPRATHSISLIHPPGNTKPDCWAVAKRRARRRVARRRLPNVLWPLISGAMLIAIAIDRKIPRFPRPLVRRRKSGENDPRVDRLRVEPRGTQGTLRAQRGANCPPEAAAVAQVVAFLVRNRGRLDNAVVREKWDRLDRLSLPLAVYLRDIEAREEWSALDAEISRFPLIPRSLTDDLETLISVRHSKICGLVQEWQGRGVEMLNLYAAPHEAIDTKHPDMKDINSTPKP